jgi:D-alanyl-D-alanine carboxypeptidase-like protein
VPGGMPKGFAQSLREAPDVASITIADADNVWMRRSFDERGDLVDRPPTGYMIPIDATAVDLRPFAAFLPQEMRPTVVQLDELEGVLSETSARLRGLGEGGELEFGDGVTVRISGILPDVLMGGYELLVGRSTGRTIGIRHERYAVFHASEDAPQRERQLERTFRGLIPPGSAYRAVEVRAPGTTRFLRMSDALLPPSLLKDRFGEFAARPDALDPGFLDVDPGWVSKNITEATVPLLGTITCHRRFVPLVRGAMRELVNEGLEELVQGYAGCYAARHTLAVPGASLSHHSWGIAIDINAEQNPFGSEPTQDERLVEVMERWGMIWGGRFIVPDGHHFEFIAPPERAVTQG